MTTLFHSPLRLLAVCMTAALLWTGCTKLTPYNGEFFDCECGDMTWASRTLNLRMAEVEALDSTTFRYHVIADLRTQAEVDAREDSRDLVLTLTTAVQGNSAALNLSSGDARLTLQEVDAPGTGIDWGMAGASLNIAVEEDRHTLALGTLTASTKPMGSGGGAMTRRDSSASARVHCSAPSVKFTASERCFFFQSKPRCSVAAS